MDNELRTLTGVVIDPGHGGVDSGAQGNNQLEKDYTLKISKYIFCIYYFSKMFPIYIVT